MDEVPDAVHTVDIEYIHAIIRVAVAEVLSQYKFLTSEVMRAYVHRFHQVGITPDAEAEQFLESVLQDLDEFSQDSLWQLPLDLIEIQFLRERMGATKVSELRVPDSGIDERWVNPMMLNIIRTVNHHNELLRVLLADQVRQSS